MAGRRVTVREVADLLGDASASAKTARYNAATLLRDKDLCKRLGPMIAEDWALVVTATTSEIHDDEDVDRLCAVARKLSREVAQSEPDPLVTHLRAAAGVAVLCGYWHVGTESRARFVGSVASDIAERALSGTLGSLRPEAFPEGSVERNWHRRFQSVRAEYLHADLYPWARRYGRVVDEEGPTRHFDVRVESLRAALVRDLTIDIEAQGGRALGRRLAYDYLIAQSVEIPLAGFHRHAGASLMGVARLVGLMCSTLRASARTPGARIAELFRWLSAQLGARVLRPRSTPDRVWSDLTLRILDAVRATSSGQGLGPVVTQRIAARIVCLLGLESDARRLIEKFGEDVAVDTLYGRIRTRDRRARPEPPVLIRDEDGRAILGAADDARALRRRRGRMNPKPAPKKGALHPATAPRGPRSA